MNLKKIMISGVALLMLSSVGTASNNINVNARHVRTHRIHKVRKTHRANKNRAYSSGVRLANLISNNKLNSTQQAKLLKRNLAKRTPLNNKNFSKGYIKQFRYRNRAGHVNFNEAKHSLQGIKIFANNYKNRLFYKGFALANMATRKQEINGYTPPKRIQRYKHDREFLKGLEAYNMFENSSKFQAKEFTSNYFAHSIA